VYCSIAHFSLWFSEQENLFDIFFIQKLRELLKNRDFVNIAYIVLQLVKLGVAPSTHFPAVYCKSDGFLLVSRMLFRAGVPY
jgi:hypothetical protein